MCVTINGPGMTLSFDRLTLELGKRVASKVVPNLGTRTGFSSYSLCTRQTDKSKAYCHLPYPTGGGTIMFLPSLPAYDKHSAKHLNYQ